MSSLLPTRQVHLDFHTHGSIEEVGADFDPAEFADTLVRARVNSINLFARCHHGYLYYSSKRFAARRHPHLKRNLLAEQIQACHARGIKAPIYLSVQWDALMVEEHPEWLVRAPDGKVNIPTYSPGFYNPLCLNTPYQEFLKELVDDIADTLPVDGFWFDILLPIDCSCPECRALMKKQGVDPTREEVRRKFGMETLWRFKREMTAFVRRRNQKCLVFYNSGHVGPALRRELDAFTHLELESLPGGQWGYVHFPATVRYARTLGKDLLGMTGKFHTTWGDFHSFKNPEALAFECFSMLANGAKCCIGDQLHPRGKICPDTYDLIGKVYAEVERREAWCEGARPVTEIGVLTPEEFSVGGEFSSLPKVVMGATRLLQEIHQQFDIIDTDADFDRYRVLILPDEIPVSDSLAGKIKAWLARGGSLIASHRAGLDPGGVGFSLPLGVEYQGVAPFTPTFVKPREPLAVDLPQTEHVMYLAGTAVKILKGAEVLADNVAPYFNRTWEHYCSHQHAPSSGRVAGPAVVRCGSCIYFVHPVFGQYASNAPRWCRTLMRNALNLLLPEPAVRTGGPATMVATMTCQAEQGRQIVHLLHYVPVRNNDNLDVVEGVIPLNDVKVSLRSEGTVKAVSLVPEMIPLDFRSIGERVEFSVPRVLGYQMVLIEWTDRGHSASR